MKELFTGSIISILQEYGFIHSEEMLETIKNEISGLFDMLPKIMTKFYIIIPLVIGLPFLIRKLVNVVKERYLEQENDRVSELLMLLKEELTNEQTQQ